MLNVASVVEAETISARFVVIQNVSHGVVKVQYLYILAVSDFGAISKLRHDVSLYYICNILP